MCAKTGKPLEPTVIAVNSQNIHAELNGWRTDRGLILRQPIQASVAYTPALARRGCLLLACATLAHACVHGCKGLGPAYVAVVMTSPRMSAARHASGVGHSRHLATQSPEHSPATALRMARAKLACAQVRLRAREPAAS